ncbi:MAG: hypothetical protein ALECFALPRED_004460 [Alectoria fallacina]|uniref:Guanine nucleotide-exchange factor SEC12 n=1 Tax=Alectoria fallacina TaxID=1903189 RepID=A0A8H3FRJ6_9LECA|nr:MAG: hypothetical protein ALECFALPRED_004460 [Alectoria fallacina]
MAPPPIPCAKITLTYPLYAADFDPQNSDFLLVGGGGGEGRSGVGNKITLLNTSKKTELSEIVDIDLSRDEDSVTSLAYAQSTEQWATAFAGINSSTAEQQKGNNEHLRSFLLEYPSKRKADGDGEDSKKEKATEYRGETKALGKASLFTPSAAKTKETFQRVLRLSKKKKSNGPRLGAVATGLAPAGEIVFFAADTSRPGLNDIRGRIKLEEKQEAADVDIIGLEGDDGQQEGKFRVAYCTDYEVYVTDVDYSNKDNGTQQSIQNIHGTPHPDAFASNKARPKFRCLRFLTPTLLLLLQNKVNGKGAELLLLETSGGITLRKSLQKKIKSATAMSVALLPTASYSQIDQHAIAVAGADTSITILTVDRFTSSPYGKVKFRPHSFLPSVHPTSITSLAFSTFNRPGTPWNIAPPQYLKLASTSIANTCVVHKLPLTPHQSPPPKDQPAHYLLKAPVRNSVTQNTISTLVALVAIAIGAFFLQAFTEIRGGTPEYLGAKGWLSKPIHDWIARPYMFEDGYPSAASLHAKITSKAARTSLSAASEAVQTPFDAVQSANIKVQKKLGLRGLLKRRDMGSDTSDNENDGTDIIVKHSPTEGRETALSAELRNSNEAIEGEQKAKRWEELKQHEKETWKKRLVDAGEWTAAEGEAVLKGVLFSGLANAVGGIVGNA